MKKDGEKVSPGDPLALIEEFIGGRNTYIDDSVIRSSVAGVVKVDWKNRVIDVEPIKQPLTIDVGDEILGKIFHISGVFGYVEIELVRKEGKGPWILLRGKYTGVVYPPTRVTDVGSTYHIRDEILARVESTLNRTLHLSIRGPRYGVVRAFCKTCRTELVRGDEPGKLVCPTCRSIETRKVSRLYGNTTIIKTLHKEKVLNTW